MTEQTIQLSIVHDLTCIGETYLEFRAPAASMTDATAFTPHLAGSAAFVACYASMLGTRTALISCLGADPMGNIIKSEFQKYKIDTDGVQYVRDAPTSLLFTARTGRLLQTAYYRLADWHLHNTKEHITQAQSSAMVHASGFSLWKNPSRHSVFELLRLAKKFDRKTVLYPMFQYALWRDRSEAMEVIKKTIQFADIVTPTLDDAENLFGKMPREDFIQRYREMGARDVILAMGRDGCLVTEKDAIVCVPACEAKIVNPAGVVDAWHAGLYFALKSGKSLPSAAHFANGVGAFVLQEEESLVQLPSADVITKQMFSKSFSEI